MQFSLNPSTGQPFYLQLILQIRNAIETGVLQPGDALYNCDGPPNTLVDLALGKDVRNWAPGELGARTVEILDAAYRSAKSGRVEQVSTLSLAGG